MNKVLRHLHTFKIVFRQSKCKISIASLFTKIDLLLKYRFTMGWPLKAKMRLLLLLAMIVLSVGADSPCFRAPNIIGARRTFQLEPEPETTTANYTVTEPGTIVTEQNATMTLNDTTELMIETSNTTVISEAVGNMTELLEDSTTSSFDQSEFNGTKNITLTEGLQMTEEAQEEESTSGITTIPMSSVMDSEYLNEVYTDEYVSAITPTYTSVSPTIIGDTSVQATTTTIYQTDQTIYYPTPTTISGFVPEEEESTSGLTESFDSGISQSTSSPMLGYSETITEIHTTLHGSITSAATMPSDFATPIPMSSVMDSEYLNEVYTGEYVPAVTPTYTSVSPTIIGDTSVQATTTTIYQTDQTIYYPTPTTISGFVPEEEESTSGLTESFDSGISQSTSSSMREYSETITEIHTTLHGSITSAATMPSDFATPIQMSSVMDSEYLNEVYTDEYVSAVTPMYTSISPTMIDDTSVQATTTTTIYQTDQTIYYPTPTTIISGSLPEEGESTIGLTESFVSGISQITSSPIRKKRR